MEIRYNVKIKFSEDSVDSKSNKARLEAMSRKQFKQTLFQLERSTVLMPDSFRFIPVKTDLKDGLVAKLMLDTIMYIRNKNKVKYIRDHHISPPANLRIVDNP